MGVASSLLINAADREHRARLLATVISAFSLVSIIGMPGMLFLCERFGWQTAPALIGVLCLLALIMIYVGLPKAFRRRWLWYKDTHHANDAVICQRQCVNPV